MRAWSLKVRLTSSRSGFLSVGPFFVRLMRLWAFAAEATTHLPHASTAALFVVIILIVIIYIAITYDCLLFFVSTKIISSSEERTLGNDVRKSLMY